MIPLLDLNVLLAAHRRDHPNHAGMLEYVNGLRAGNHFFGVPELALSGVARIATFAPSFKPPSTTEEVFNFTAAILASPKCMLVRPTKSHWRVFESLARTVGARGKLVPDAYLAAMAIDQGFEFITNDSDFSLFPGLTWRAPLATHSISNPH